MHISSDIVRREGRSLHSAHIYTETLQIQMSTSKKNRSTNRFSPDFNGSESNADLPFPNVGERLCLWCAQILQPLCWGSLQIIFSGEVCWCVATQLLRMGERHLGKEGFLVSGDNKPKNGTQCWNNDETDVECRLMISTTFIWEKIQLFRTKIVH